jgi:hypothetical protein
MGDRAGRNEHNVTTAELKNNLRLMENNVAASAMVKWPKCSYGACAVYKVPEITVGNAHSFWAHIHSEGAEWRVREYRAEEAVDGNELKLKVSVLLHQIRHPQAS